MRITQISVNNPVFATMMMVGIVVMGLFAYQRLSVDQMPDITFPFVQVQTSYAGASSEAVMQDVTRPIEEAINTISGIKSIRSFSREGFSRVMVEFDIRHLIDRQSLVCKQSHDDDTDHHHGGEDRVVDADLGDSHSCSLRRFFSTVGNRRGDLRDAKLQKPTTLRPTCCQPKSWGWTQAALRAR